MSDIFYWRVPSKLVKTLIGDNAVAQSAFSKYSQCDRQGRMARHNRKREEPEWLWF